MTKALLAVGLVGALLGVAAGVYLLTRQPGLAAEPAGYGFRFLAEVGDEYTFAKSLFHNESDAPIELRGVRVVSAPGLTSLGVLVADTQAFRESVVVFGPGYPPPQVSPEDAHPVAGYVVDPGAAVRLLIGLRIDSPGVHDLAGPIGFEYGPSLFSHSMELPYAIRICAPAAAICAVTM